MQDLLVEIQGFELHGIPQPVLLQPILRTRFQARQWSAYFLGFKSGLVGLQHDVIERVRVVYAEVIMVGTR